MSIPVVHLFAADTAFRDTSKLYASLDPQQDACNLTKTAQSYFSDLRLLKDPRTTRSPAPAFYSFNSTSTSYLCIDSAYYADAYDLFIRMLGSNTFTQVFEMLDYCIYKHYGGRTAAEMDTTLSGYSSYAAGSVVLGDVINATVYNNADTYAVLVPTYVSITVTLTDPDAGESQQYELRFWASSAAFEAGYAVSIVEVVVPPLASYQELLEASLTAAVDNQFTVGSATLAASVDAIATTIAATDSTGYLSYPVKVIDTAGTVILVRFAILYKGQRPDRAVIREAIRDAVLNSGVGTEALWKDRIPELFIVGTMFIIPLWDNTYTTATTTLNRSSAGISAAVDTARVALSQFGSDYVYQSSETLHVAYNRMISVVVPHEENDTSLSVKGLHPTYQSYDSTSTQFQYMESITKDFSLSLNALLPVCAGETTTDVDSVTSNNGTYYPFVDGNKVEWLVMTKESYLNLV